MRVSSRRSALPGDPELLALGLGGSFPAVPERVLDLVDGEVLAVVEDVSVVERDRVVDLAAEEHRSARRGLLPEHVAPAPVLRFCAPEHRPFGLGAGRSGRQTSAARQCPVRTDRMCDARTKYEKYESGANSGAGAVSAWHSPVQSASARRFAAGPCAVASAQRVRRPRRLGSGSGTGSLTPTRRL